MLRVPGVWAWEFRAYRDCRDLLLVSHVFGLGAPDASTLRKTAMRLRPALSRTGGANQLF